MGTASGDARIAKVDAVIEAFMAARHVPGMTVAIQAHGVTVLSKGYGVRDLVRKSPVMPTTRFEIGSLTKQFTAAAVLRLAAAGKLRLSDPLARYVPRYAAARNVTIRQLLTHASGIPDYVATNHFLATASHRPGGFDQILALVEHVPLDFPPGTKSAYSNTNYILLGRIIEAAAGVEYDRYVRENVLAAAGMMRTTTIAEENRLNDMATGYNTGVVADLAQSIDPATDAGAAARIEPGPAFGAAWAWSAGDLVSDVSDMLAWDDAFFGGRIVSLADVARATEPAVLADGTVTQYGFGWEIDRVDGHRRIFFDGGTFGFASTNQTWPDDRLRIVILSNSAAAPLTRLGQRVFEAFTGVPPADQRARRASTTADTVPHAKTTAANSGTAARPAWSATTPAASGPSSCPVPNTVVTAVNATAAVAASLRMRANALATAGVAHRPTPTQIAPATGAAAPGRLEIQQPSAPVASGSAKLNRAARPASTGTTASAPATEAMPSADHIAVTTAGGTPRAANAATAKVAYAM